MQRMNRNKKRSFEEVQLSKALMKVKKKFERKGEQNQLFCEENTI